MSFFLVHVKNLTQLDNNDYIYITCAYIGGGVYHLHIQMTILMCYSCAYIYEKKQRIKMVKKQCSKSRKAQKWRRYLLRMLHGRVLRQMPVSFLLYVIMSCYILCLCRIFKILCTHLNFICLWCIWQMGITPYNSAFHAWWWEYRPRNYSRRYGL